MRMAKAKLLAFELGRDEVVRSAQAAISLVRREGTELSYALIRRLLRVARTAPEFAVGDWWIDGRCGCLIGNLYGGVPERMSCAEYLVGLEFDGQITARLGQRDEARYLASLLRERRPSVLVRVRDVA